MPFFPAFINITKKPVLVVGAGPVAARKIQKLLMFSPNIHIVADKANEEVHSLLELNDSISFEKRPFDFTDIDGKDLIVVAIDDTPLQKKIFEVCESKKILCNCADSADLCNFIFPALVVRGDLTIGINTAGRAPYVSARVRKLLDNYLPAELDQLVKKASEFRKSIPDKKQATEKIKTYVDTLFSKITP